MLHIHPRKGVFAMDVDIPLIRIVWLAGPYPDSTIVRLEVVLLDGSGTGGLRFDYEKQVFLDSYDSPTIPEIDGVLRALAPFVATHVKALLSAKDGEAVH